MTDIDTAAAEMRSELEHLVEPLTGQLERTLAMIEAKESDLKELRRSASNMRRVLDLLAPEKPVVKRKRAQKGDGSPWGVHPETFANVENWLIENRERIDSDENGGFSGSGLIREHGFKIVGRHTLDTVLGALHERGTIRLDHKGHGGARFWRFVA
jgi:hypothetical protein